MLNTRTYNTKTTPVAGWKTIDKRSQIEVVDSLTGYAVHIKFDKNPKIYIFENSSCNNFGSMVGVIKLNTNTGELSVTK